MSAAWISGRDEAPPDASDADTAALERYVYEDEDYADTLAVKRYAENQICDMESRCGLFTDAESKQWDLWQDVLAFVEPRLKERRAHLTAQFWSDGGARGRGE